MMSKVPTVHDILGTIEGLRNYAQALKDAATTKVHDIEGFGTGVLSDPASMIEISLWMIEAADELQLLIPDGPLTAMGSRQRTRTLVRIEGFDPQSNQIRVVLPGWNPDASMVIVAPEEVTDRLEGQDPDQFMERPFRVYAWVNLSALSSETLEFSDWEVVGPRKEEKWQQP